MSDPVPVLSVRALSVDYVTAAGPVRAVERVSFDLARGEVLGIAGESGSGKSTVAQAILRILPPPAVITGGQALLEGKDLFRMSEAELRAVRWPGTARAPCVGPSIGARPCRGPRDCDESQGAPARCGVSRRTRCPSSSCVRGCPDAARGRRRCSPA